MESYHYVEIDKIRKVGVKLVPDFSCSVTTLQPVRHSGSLNSLARVVVNNRIAMNFLPESQERVCVMPNTSWCTCGNALVQVKKPKHTLEKVSWISKVHPDGL